MRLRLPGLGPERLDTTSESAKKKRDSHFSQVPRFVVRLTWQGRLDQETTA